ncbi:MAG: FHA domain-containing protein [Planctomycetes bacterium]|nr:FHA domain-containing protein [Planctomycetota bacterium]
MPILAVRAEGREERFALKPGVFTVGRALECEVRIRDLKSSRRHCRITIDGKGAHVVDLGSGNGTRLNGNPLDREEPLRNGDCIEIGTTTLLFVAGAEDTATRFPGVGEVTSAEKSAALKATSRLPTSKSRRYVEEAGRRGVPPLAVFVGVTVALGATVVTLVLLFQGPSRLQLDREEVTRLVTEAAKEAPTNPDAAIAKYRHALALCEKHRELGTTAASIRASISDIEGTRTRKNQAAEEWRRARERLPGVLASTDRAAIKEFLDDLQRMLESHRALGVPWTGELEKAIERVDERRRKIGDDIDPIPFSKAKSKIVRDFTLDDPASADYAGALKAWDAYIEKLIALRLFDPAVRDQVAEAKRDVARRAAGAWDSLRKEIDAAVAEGRKEEALARLKQALPRFEGCRITDASGAVTRDVEKEIRDRIAHMGG